MAISVEKLIYPRIQLIVYIHTKWIVKQEVKEWWNSPWAIFAILLSVKRFLASCQYGIFLSQQGNQQFIKNSVHFNPRRALPFYMICFDPIYKSKGFHKNVLQYIIYNQLELQRLDFHAMLGHANSFSKLS